MHDGGRMMTENVPWALFAGFGLIAGIIWLAVIAFTIVVGWKIFTKAGKPGWACIIPVYNVLVFLQIINRPWWWIFLFFIPFVNIVMIIIAYNDLSKSFGKDAGFTVGLVLVNIVFMAILAFDKSVYTRITRPTDMATPSQPMTPPAQA